MRLLLAEDEEELSRAVVAILEASNYSVDAVYNGDDAYDYLTQGVYDGAILDIMMPGMDGLEVLKRLRDDDNDVPVLFLTAKSVLDDVVAGLDAGADDYVTKPFKKEELLARIRSMTRRSETTINVGAKFKDLSLDDVTFTIKCGEKEVALIRKEYQILSILLKNPGQIFSADMIFESVWGLDSDSDSSVVWVNISNIRKKIAKVGSEVVIKSSRGLGYSVV